MKIYHIITGLKRGGAEGFLLKLVECNTENSHLIVSLGSCSDALVDKFKVLGHEVVTNALRPKIFLKLLYGLLTSDKCTTVIQGWMYHGNLVGFVLSILSRRKLIFNVRHSNFNKVTLKRLTRFIVFLNIWISRYFNIQTIACAHSIVREHAYHGWPKERFVVVPNGIRFRKSIDVSSKKMKVTNNHDYFTFGMLARFHPQKGYTVLIDAIADLSSKYEFQVIIGGPDTESEEFNALLRQRKFVNEVNVLGEIDDTRSFYSRIDCLLVPSIDGEGFPNVILEAGEAKRMSVVTNVGDASSLVPDKNFVIEANDVLALSVGMERAMNMSEKHRNDYVNSLRTKYERMYDIKKISSLYTDLWSGKQWNNQQN